MTGATRIPFQAKERREPRWRSRRSPATERSAATKETAKPTPKNGMSAALRKPFLDDDLPEPSYPDS
jgi:hypothetical protein